MALKKKPVTRYHHGDLRAALLSGAWSIVAKRGLDALSLRSLADAVGVSHAAPAHHFSDKNALIDALREEAWKRFAEVLEAAEPAGLRQLGRAYVAFAVEHPRQMQLMFRSGASPTQEMGTQGGRAWSALSRAVAREVGPKRAADPKELNAMSLAAWAGVHGLAALLTEVTLPEQLTGKSAEALRERVLDAVHAGIARS
jgi:AcrR family transcriptional regulator